ncbi:MAG: hypothetical protein V1835_02260 [Candidatus Micrarchaeota archaeon]
MKLPALLVVLLPLALLLLGCTATRDVKTAVCLVKKQPGENQCLEKLAIDSKDVSPCHRIKLLSNANGTILLPTKNTCYAQVAFWKADPAVCDGLNTETEKSECRHRYDLYVETAKVK